MRQHCHHTNTLKVHRHVWWCSECAKYLPANTGPAVDSMVATFKHLSYTQLEELEQELIGGSCCHILANDVGAELESRGPQVAQGVMARLLSKITDH